MGREWYKRLSQPDAVEAASSLKNALETGNLFVLELFINELAILQGIKHKSHRLAITENHEELFATLRACNEEKSFYRLLNYSQSELVIANIAYGD